MLNIKRMLFVFIGIAFLALITILIIRAFSYKEIDDVTPGIPCSNDLLFKSDILWVIPLFGNESIAENKEWCTLIKGLNKTIGLHGVYHTYEEFSIRRDEKYLAVGINAFEKCLGFAPSMFKAPQLALSKENKNLLEEMEFIVKGKWNQLIHKVYHCSDTGVFSNTIVERF